MYLSIGDTNTKNERGESLVSLLVGIALASIIMTTATANFVGASRLAKDHQMINRAEAEARSVLDLMAFDIRMTGTGMPLGQAGFLITDTTLGTAPLPVLTTSSATSIAFRMNQNGAMTVLSSSYTPSTTSTTFSVASSTGLATGDQVYISDLSAGGTSGLRGVISSKTSNSITLSSGFVHTAAAVFSSGSSVSKVSDVTYSSTSPYSGIFRNEGSGSIVLSPNCEFSASYLDTNGAVLTLPLTATSIQDSLGAIRVTVQVRSTSPLVSGDYYTAVASQTIALRNLNLLR